MKKRKAHLLGVRGIAFAVLLSAAGTSWSALPEEAPPVQEILRAVRLGQSAQEIALKGRLREEGRTQPFVLSATEGVVRYQFSDPTETYELRLGEGASELYHWVGEASPELLNSRTLKREVRGSGITAEELALGFLYWPDARLEDEQIIKSRRCWVVRLISPARDSQYSVVFVWVDQAAAAILRMEGYDWNGKLAKRFEVISGQKIDGQWTLKSMRIEAFDPERNKVSRRSYLEIEDAAAAPN